MNLIVTANEVIKEFYLANVPTTKNVDGDTVADIDLIETTLMEAQLEVFGYLRNVGIDTDNLTNATIQEIRRHVLNITRYKFNSRVGGSLKPDSTIMISYNLSVETLTKISKGIIVLSSVKSPKSGFRTIRVETWD